MFLTQDISIHAPRTGSDSVPPGRTRRLIYFNPRSPHGERQPCASSPATVSVFQSTLPARGATTSPISSGKSTTYFNPRSPHGERPGEPPPWAALDLDFNPRSPHGERRGPFCVWVGNGSDFNPRSPHGERPQGETSNQFLCENFNPRSPHGERLAFGAVDRPAERFQSTLPARGATVSCDSAGVLDALAISIHAPRTGSDRIPVSTVNRHEYFNPRSPHGERRRLKRAHQGVGYFNPRSPHGERH